MLGGGRFPERGRSAWVYRRQGAPLGAFLVLKPEDEPVECSPPLPRNKRVKICTIKVAEMGQKIGELFVKTAIQYAVRNNSFEIYLTRFTKNPDELVKLISEFGFCKAARKGNGEDVYLKRLLPNENVKSPVEMSERFYPSFYDGRLTDKFVIPIRPEYHNRLFTDYPRRQALLPEYGGRLIIEGNTIKKAYLCHSNIRWLSPGDILLFYRSEDEKCITSLGVVERVYDSSSPDRISGYVGKRTVYSRDEIQAMARKNVKVIMFTLHFHFPNPVKLTYMRQNRLLAMAPRSILKLEHNKYLRVREAGGIDERFAFDSTDLRKRSLTGQKSTNQARDFQEKKHRASLHIFIVAGEEVNRNFYAGELMEGSPRSIWSRCRRYSGIDADTFFAYFRGKRKAFAIGIEDLFVFDAPIDRIQHLTNFKPPQSFRYFDDTVVRELNGQL